MNVRLLNLSVLYVNGAENLGAKQYQSFQADRYTGMSRGTNVAKLLWSTATCLYVIVSNYGAAVGTCTGTFLGDSFEDNISYVKRIN